MQTELRNSFRFELPYIYRHGTPGLVMPTLISAHLSDELFAPALTVPGRGVDQVDPRAQRQVYGLDALLSVKLAVQAAETPAADAHL